jgi:hypothetical protein
VKQYSASNPPVVVQSAAPTDTSVVWVDPNDNSIDEFSDMVNLALAQAKESGEFDGKDGTSATHSWNGTVLTISSASGISSADLKGAKGDKGDKGDTGDKGADGSPGSAGKNGSDGYTPVRGTDYWTPTDRQQIKQELTAAMVTQEAGESETLVMSQKAVTAFVNEALGESETTEYETVDSVDEMTDPSKQYILSATGTLWACGEVAVEKAPENVFIPENAILNQRIGTNSDSAKNGHYITEYLEFDASTASSPIVWLPLNYDPTIGDQRIRYCDASNTKLGNIYGCNMTAQSDQVYIGKGEDGRYYFDLSKDGSGNTTGLSKHYPSMKRLRMSLSSGKTTAITVSDIADVEILFEKDRGTTIENQWYDTELTPSAGGGGNYVGLLTKVNRNATDIKEISNRVTAIESKSGTVTVPTFWEDAVASCIAKIKALQVGRNCVTFPFFSDNHQNTRYAGAMIAHIMKECHIPYCFFGGDAISNGSDVTSEAIMIEQDSEFDAMMSVVPVERMCRTLGNHDAYWNPTPDSGSSTRVYYTRDQIYDLFLRQESVSQNKHYGGDGTYYYVDDVASKTRFVLCNTNVNVNTTTETLDSEQISWLENEAMAFSESGWNLVFLSHQPITNHYHSNIYEDTANGIREALTNYVSGNDVNKADIVGWFAGHIHADRIYTGVAANTLDDSVKNTLPWKTVTIRADHTALCRDEDLTHTVADDDQSHAIDFVTINRKTRTVNLTRLGIGEDRSYSY